VDYTFALRFFAILLTILCVTLATFVIRREEMPTKSELKMDALPPMQAHDLRTRTAIACLLASFVLLLMAGVFVLDYAPSLNSPHLTFQHHERCCQH
jgi:hypothetical protein